MKLEKWSWMAGIVAAIVGILAWLVDRNDFIVFCKSAGKFITTPFSIIFNWLSHPVTWPVWALILVAFSGLAMVAFLFFLFSRHGNTQPEPTDPLNYRTDEIFGVQWTWGFVYGRLNENDLSAFCPKKSCMCRLKCQPNQNARYNPNFHVFPISLVCPNCGFQRDFDNDLEQLKRDVLIEVERRIRTGDFQRMAHN
jgi:hypothetical protein